MKKTCDQCKSKYESTRASKLSFCSDECRYRHKRLVTPLKNCRGCSSKVTRVGTGYKYCDRCITRRQAERKVAHSIKENSEYKRKTTGPVRRFPNRDTSCDGSAYF